MQIHFLLTNRNKPKSSIRMHVFHRGQEYRLSVGESVLTKYWNFDKNRCKLVREYTEAGFINKRLDEYENIIKEIINKYGIVTPTQAQVKADFTKYKDQTNINAGGISQVEQQQYFVPFILEYIKDCDRKRNTIKHYHTTINKLLEYEHQYRMRLRFFDIDIVFYNSFKKWILSQTIGNSDKHYTKNYVGSLFKDIKAFMRRARSMGLHDFKGFEDEAFSVDKEETDAIYLTMEEILKIYNLNITEELLLSNGYDNRHYNLSRAIQSLREERDRFLIGCFTALRHSDYSRIDSLNFKDDIISIWTQKKDKKVYIPVHYLLREILQRRNNELPKPISDQKHNKHIKELGRLAGIDEDVILSKTRGENRQAEVRKKYEFITTHTARRSGASNMYLAGIDVKFIQDLLGHSKVEQTLKYIKVAAEDNARRLQSHSYFTGK
nr:MAG TPA: Integrase [Bacteriophage sp.]